MRLSPTGRSASFPASSMRRGVLAVTAVLVLIAAGAVSLALGADDNWDLRNYHLYNPYAWSTGREARDLIPAGFHTYFNPLLDVPWYWAFTRWPSRWAGFGVGALHGSMFILVWFVARRVIGGARGGDVRALLVAAAGCCTTAYLFGFATSTGDVTTALLIVGAVACMTTAAGAPGLRRLVCAGVLAGVAVGLKPTNVVFATGLLAATPWVDLRLPDRLLRAAVFGAAVVAGDLVSAGWWYAHQWTAHGNPLYPQFGLLFPDPQVQSRMVLDLRNLPRDWFERLAWPYVFTQAARTAFEYPVRQIIWGIVYTAMLAWLGARVLRRRPRADRGALCWNERLLLAFAGTSFVAWMLLFSIHRYLVAVEVLLPVVLVVLLRRLLPTATASVAAFALIGIATAYTASGGLPTLGRAAWADPLYRIDAPDIAAPEGVTAVLYSTRTSWGWLVTGLPAAIEFVQIDSNFPGTGAFDAFVRRRILQRTSRKFAIIDGHYVAPTTGESRAAPATGPLVSTSEDARFARTSQPVFARYGLVLDPARCVPYNARVGSHPHVYQWCELQVTATTGDDRSESRRPAP